MRVQRSPRAAMAATCAVLNRRSMTASKLSPRSSKGGMHALLGGIRGQPLPARCCSRTARVARVEPSSSLSMAVFHALPNSPKHWRSNPRGFVCHCKICVDMAKGRDLGALRQAMFPKEYNFTCRHLGGTQVVDRLIPSILASKKLSYSGMIS